MVIDQVFKHYSGAFFMSPETLSHSLFLRLHLSDEVVVEDMTKRTVTQIVNEAGKSDIAHFSIRDIEVRLSFS